VPDALATLAEAGFTVLSERSDEIPSREWEGLRYVDWKSGGDTRFAPIASATGELECQGFWHLGRPERDGVWTSNAQLCPSLVSWARRVGAAFGRVRVIELRPTTYEEAVGNLHQDVNNRLNPSTNGRVVRAWLELTDQPDSEMILREDREDPATERRIPLRRGAQYVVDSERLWHAVAHPGDKPRYALIASFVSGPELESWIACEARGG
jgi:hypothetical protein